MFLDVIPFRSLLCGRYPRRLSPVFPSVEASHDPDAKNHPEPAGPYPLNCVQWISNFPGRLATNAHPHIGAMPHPAG